MAHSDLVRKVIESFRHVFSFVHLPSEEFSEKNDLLLLKYSLCIFLEIISTPHSLHKIKMVVTNALQSVSFEKYYIRIHVISGRLGKKLSYTTRCFQGSDVFGE